MLLQARGRRTAQQLAAELEVSVRTVYRDVEALQAAGIPLVAEAGSGGGYELLAGYRSRLTGLTTGEAAALFLTGLPGPAAELGLGAAVATAQLKLQATLPAELRARADRVRERFHLDAPGWYRDADDAPHLTAVAAAVWEQRRLRVRYRRWRQPEEVERVLDPYGLVLKAGTWYLVAAVHGLGEPAEPRTYRVNQILELDPLTEPAERPDGFDLAAHWQTYLAGFSARLQRDVAEIRLSARGRERLPGVLSAAADALERTASAPDQHGWVTATVPIESVGHACDTFLRLAAEVEVLSPPALREQLSATARRLHDLYVPDTRCQRAGPTVRVMTTSSAGCCPVMELRQYTLHPGQRDVLIDLFDGQLIEPQEELGMRVLGQFRDLDDPNRFVWLRGFADMSSRHAGLTGFYGGPNWAAHKDAANATMVDSDDVLLLRPAWPDSAFLTTPGGRPPVNSTGRPPSLFTVTTYFLGDPVDEEFLDFFSRRVEPLLTAAGSTRLAALRTETAENTFPALPVRENEHVFVRFARFSSLDEHTAYGEQPMRAPARRDEDELQQRLTRQPEQLRLQPTARSLLR